MWKKDDTRNETPATEKGKATMSRQDTDNTAIISESLKINGEISGSADLLVSGTIDGEINLTKNTVTICESGSVTAKIQAGVIIVEGRANGDLHGKERVEVKRTGNVEGNIISPRVGLEDGAKFKGNIDMTTGNPTPLFDQDSKSTGGSNKHNEQSVQQDSSKKH